MRVRINPCRLLFCIIGTFRVRRGGSADDFTTIEITGGTSQGIIAAIAYAVHIHAGTFILKKVMNVGPPVELSPVIVAGFHEGLRGDYEVFLVGGLLGPAPIFISCLFHLFAV